MRAVLAAGLVLFLVFTAAAPHIHRHPGHHEDCTACVLSSTEPPRTETPDVAPVVRAAGEAASCPGLPPIAGFPLGAVSGQSPPAGV